MVPKPDTANCVLREQITTACVRWRRPRDPPARTTTHGDRVASAVCALADADARIQRVDRRAVGSAAAGFARWIGVRHGVARLPPDADPSLADIDHGRLRCAERIVPRRSTTPASRMRRSRPRRRAGHPVDAARSSPDRARSPRSSADRRRQATTTLDLANPTRRPVRRRRSNASASPRSRPGSGRTTAPSRRNSGSAIHFDDSCGRARARAKGADFARAIPCSWRRSTHRANNSGGASASGCEAARASPVRRLFRADRRDRGVTRGDAPAAAEATASRAGSWRARRRQARRRGTSRTR